MGGGPALGDGRRGAQQRGLRGPHRPGAGGPSPLGGPGDLRPGRRGVHGRGVPPIAAAIGALPELITPSVDGRLFTPGNASELAAAIADVERNPEDYERYGEAARKTYEQRFDPERSVADLLDIYRYAIKPPVRG